MNVWKDVVRPFPLISGVSLLRSFSVMIQRIRGRVQIPDKTIKWLVFNPILVSFHKLYQLSTFSDPRNSYPRLDGLTFFPSRLIAYCCFLSLQNLVIRFLKKAASNLQQPFKVVVPSHKLPLHDRYEICNEYFLLTNSQGALHMADPTAVG